jgi:hypothetical protein
MQIRSLFSPTKTLGRGDQEMQRRIAGIEDEDDYHDKPERQAVHLPDAARQAGTNYIRQMSNYIKLM